MNIKIGILSSSGLLIPARDFITQLPEKEAQQIEKFINEFESKGSIENSFAESDGPGRYKIQIRDADNRLKGFIMEILDPPVKEQPIPKRGILNFYAEKSEQWIYPQHLLYFGRSGEEFYVKPEEIEPVLEDIRQKRSNPFYSLRSDGTYSIDINTNGRRIFGRAVWE